MKTDAGTSLPPLTRLGTGMLAVMIGGIALLHVSPAAAAMTGQEPIAAGISSPALARSTESESSRESPASPERDFVLFAWPVPLGSLCMAESPWPAVLDYDEWPACRAGLVTDVYQRCGIDRWADVGDAFLIWPELLFDGVSGWIGSPSGRPLVRTWEDYENRSVTGRMMDVQVALRHQRISTVFLQQWAEREQKYLGEFEESRANTYGFQNRSEGADLRELGIDQRKLLLDSLRRTYLARYKMQSEEHLPEEAWACARWSGMDFALLPPLIGGLLYFRGINKRFSMGEMGLRIAIEPVSELVSRKRDRSVAAAVEWTVKGLPFGVIVSAGLHGGGYAMDFVGIGTSLGAARTVVDLQYDVRR